MKFKFEARAFTRLFAALFSELTSEKHTANEVVKLGEKLWATLNSQTEEKKTGGRIRFDFMTSVTPNGASTNHHWHIIIWVNEVGEWGYAKDMSEFSWFTPAHEKMVVDAIAALAKLLLGEKFYLQIIHQYQEETVSQRLEQIIENNGSGPQLNLALMANDELPILKKLPWLYFPTKYQPGSAIQFQEGRLVIYGLPREFTTIHDPAEIRFVAERVFPTAATPEGHETLMPPVVWYMTVRPIIQEFIQQEIAA